MGFGHHPHRAARIFFTFVLSIFLCSCHRDVSMSRNTADAVVHQKETHPVRLLEAQQRELFLASRQGLQFGVPRQAIPHAVSQMRVMERAMVGRSGGAGSAATSNQLNATDFSAVVPSL